MWGDNQNTGMQQESNTGIMKDLSFEDIYKNLIWMSIKESCKDLNNFVILIDVLQEMMKVDINEDYWTKINEKEKELRIKFGNDLKIISRELAIFKLGELKFLIEKKIPQEIIAKM